MRPDITPWSYLHEERWEVSRGEAGSGENVAEAANDAR